MLLQNDKQISQLSFVEKHERPVAAIDLLTESLVEEYIHLRHAITDDYDEIMARWGQGSRVYWMSTKTVYASFMANDVEKNVLDAQISRLIRLVEVEWVRPLSLGFWMAQFITIDYYPGQKDPIINIWRAYVRAAMTTIPYENKSFREQNPYGFLVRNYAISYVGTPGDPKSYLNTAKDIRNEVYEY
jgi:type IV secretory pathway component VirB8